MFRNLPKVTKNLLIINTIIWFAAFLMNRMGNDTLMNLFALHFPSGSEDSRFRIWQLLSYMFLHDDTRIWHLLFNMYTLAIFGQVLERVWEEASSFSSTFSAAWERDYARSEPSTYSSAIS